MGLAQPRFWDPNPHCDEHTIEIDRFFGGRTLVSLRREATSPRDEEGNWKLANLEVATQETLVLTIGDLAEADVRALGRLFLDYADRIRDF